MKKPIVLPLIIALCTLLRCYRDALLTMGTTPIAITTIITIMTMINPSGC